MIRKYNYTGRVKIPKSRIRITQSINNKVKSFSAKVDLAGFPFPDNAKIYIEPYFKSTFMRFDFGTVSRFEMPSDTYLNDIPITDRVLYKVKVVDETKVDGLILGYCDEISPIVDDTLGGKISILPVDFNDLGNRIWRLDFRSEGPVLAVNYEGNIERIRELVKDSKFLGLVYPEVVRQICEKILNDEEFNLESPSAGWIKNWLKFFKESLQIQISSEPLSEIDKAEIIENIVDAFCKKQNAIGHITL